MLWLVSMHIQPEEIQINDLTLDDVKKDVRIRGIVSKVITKEKTLFIELMQPSTATVILFKENKDTRLNEGDYIEAVGRIEEYNGKPELIANLVKMI